MLVAVGFGVGVSVAVGVMVSVGVGLAVWVSVAVGGISVSVGVLVAVGSIAVCDGSTICSVEPASKFVADEVHAELIRRMNRRSTVISQNLRLIKRELSS